MDAKVLEAFFTPQRAWFLASSPLGSTPETVALQVVCIDEGDKEFVPFFESKILAELSAKWLLPPGIHVLQATSFSNVRFLGQLLDALMEIGRKSIAFNPGKEHEPERISIRTIRNELYEKIFGYQGGGPAPSAN